MAFTACRQMDLPLDVTQRIENLLLQEHQQAFIKRYGRTMPCREMTKGNAMPYTESLPQPPGFKVYGWFLRARYHKRLKAGMEFLQMAQLTAGARIVKSTTESGLTISGKGGTMPNIDTSFELLRDVILFASSPGAYMLFVGREQYKGDLTDLKPIKEGRHMCEMEMDIRQAHWEQAREAEFTRGFDTIREEGETYYDSANEEAFSDMIYPDTDED